MLVPEPLFVVLVVLLEPPPQALSRTVSTPVAARWNGVFFDMLRL